MLIEEVKHKYNEYNTLFFNGVLPRVTEIHFYFDVVEEDTAGYTFVNNIEGSEFSLHRFGDEFKYAIAINPEVCKSERDICETLCHEMIHLYQFWLNFKKYAGPNSWHLQHGRVFTQKMNFINEEAKRLRIPIKLNCVFEGNNGAGK